MDQQVLLYSVGKYIQYPVKNHNGKELEKEYIYIYVVEKKFIWVFPYYLTEKPK